MSLAKRLIEHGYREVDGQFVKRGRTRYKATSNKLGGQPLYIGIGFEKTGVIEFDKNMSLFARNLSAKEVKQIFRKALKPYQVTVKQNAPVLTKDNKEGVHHRKINGKIVATYHRGNLRRSFQHLRLRYLRRSASILFGPRRKKGGAAQGIFRGRRVDGWYGHFLEFGIQTSKYEGFQEKSWRHTRSLVTRTALSGLKNQVEK